MIPLRFKQAITSAILAAAADILAQSLGPQKKPHNWRRTFRIGLYGLLWVGPSNHFWQLILERLFPRKSDPLRPFKKVAFDQFTYGPLNNIMFMTFIARMVDGKSWEATRATIRKDYTSVQVNGWRLWPLAQFINQSFVPLDMRVLWTNLVSLFWTSFLIMRVKSGAVVPRVRLPMFKAKRHAH